jgi:hypothetical protein
MFVDIYEKHQFKTYLIIKKSFLNSKILAVKI